jgi:hypothetical protein
MVRSRRRRRTMSVVAEPLVTAEEFIRRHGNETGVE